VCNYRAVAVRGNPLDIRVANEIVSVDGSLSRRFYRLDMDTATGDYRRSHLVARSILYLFLFGMAYLSGEIVDIVIGAGIIRWIAPSCFVLFVLFRYLSALWIGIVDGRARSTAHSRDVRIHLRGNGRLLAEIEG